jgi:prolyl-tRNA editing enzyme YbaK/EbsC (Cys-tRNA(Pro) deacylase)
VELSNYHAVVSKIVSQLRDNDCWHETFEHEPVRTSEEAVGTRPGYGLEQGAKAIIVRVKKSKKQKFFAMLVFPANCRFNSNFAKDYFEAKDIRFATEDEVETLTDGVLPGGVPPFGNLFELPVYVATELFDNETIVFNAGDRRFSVAMRSADYQALVNPVLLSGLI